VDDLAIAANEPEAIIEALTGKHKLALKGTGPLKFHLGCVFKRDPDNTLAFGPKTYVEKMLVNYQINFHEKPKEASSPLEKNDHPEIEILLIF
jgi:hypothetical protein